MTGSDDPHTDQPTPRTAFGIALQRSLDAERAAAARAVHVESWRPRPHTYDEWRAFLGLPAVSEEVRAAAARRQIVEEITATAVGVVKMVSAIFGTVQAQLQPIIQEVTAAAEAFVDGVTAAGTHTPSIWAHDPTKTRRPR